MSIIIDANAASSVIEKKTDSAEEIFESINKGRAKAVTGGKLTRELLRTKFKMIMVEWVRSGRMKTIQCDLIQQSIESLDISKCKSNDIHVIALATVSESMIVVTEDVALSNDLKNRALIQPIRKIIRSTTSRRNTRKLLSDYG